MAERGPAAPEVLIPAETSGKLGTSRREVLLGAVALVAGTFAPHQSEAGTGTASAPPEPDPRPVGAAPGEPAADDTPLHAAVDPARLDELALTLLAPEFGAEQVDAAVEALALAGIAVHQNPGDLLGMRAVEGPPSPVTLLLWQVRQMALELSQRAGVLGAGLDELVEPRPGVPPPSYLIAGYVATAETTGGELARRLLGERDWSKAPEQVYPSLILALCGSDLALDVAPPAGIRSLSYTAVRPSVAAAPNALVDVCGLVGGYVSSVVNALFNALKVNEPASGAGKVLAKIWNFLVSLAQQGVDLALEVLTDAVLGVVKAIAGVIGLGSLVLSALKQWTISLQAVPAATHFGVGGEIVQGEVRVHVTHGGLGEWPAEVVSCASAGGVALPSLAPGGAKLSWKLTETPIDLVSIANDPGLLDDDGRATLIYLTNNESEEQAAGDPKEGLLTVKATVDRPDLEQLKNAIADLSFAALPGIVQTVLVPILGNKAKAILGGLVALAAMQATRTVTVVYHEPKPTPTPTPTATPAPTSIPGASCPFGKWAVVNFAEYSESVARSYGADVSYQAAGGSSTFSVSKKKLTFTWTFDSLSIIGTQVIEGMGTLNVLITMSGSVSGDVELEKGALHLIKQSRDFGMTMAATLDGVDMGAQEVDPVLFGVSKDTTMTYTCTATGMEVVQSTAPAAIPLRLEPL